VSKTPPSRQTLLFSATMSKEIERVAKEVLKSPVLVEIGARSTPAEAVTQYVVEVSPAGKIPALIHLLKDAALESVLVFSRTKHGADRIGRKLGAAGIPTATLHSNRTQGQRLLALKRFRSGDVRVLIATDIAARGIDVDGISHVINFDFPPQPEDYVHRIGRTGRAQAIGDAISFVTHEDADGLRKLERFLGRGITRKKLDGYVAAAPTATAVTAAHARTDDGQNRHEQPRRPKGAWHPKGPRSGSFGPKRFGQRRGQPQGRRGRT
jgi:ATP-dependent RNA helicase RhlE